MKHMTAWRRPSVATIAVAALVATVPLATGSAGAARTIHESVASKLTLRGSKAADGAVTVEVVFASTNSHCLTRNRFFPKGATKLPIDSELEYGALSSDSGSGPVGNDPKYGHLHGTGYSDQPSLLRQVTPPGHSPWIWRAVWSGSTPVTVRNFLPYAPSGPPPAVTSYPSTISAATGWVAWAVGLGPYETTYDQGGTKVVLTCTPAGLGNTNKWHAFRPL